MDDPATEISQMLGRFQVQVRKPEKDTKPKVYYIEGDAASLNPTYSSTPKGYIWSEIPKRVYQIAPPRLEQAEVEARRVYDQGQSHSDTWGFRVAAYLWTKSIAAGIPLMACIAGAYTGMMRFTQLEIVVALISLAITAALLVSDLKKPSRFHWIVFRPQWRSWLTRGAFVLIGFGGLLALDLLFGHLIPVPALFQILFPLTAIFALASAVYSAFLFAQAKGRDFWQSPLFGVHLAVMAVLAGAAIMIILNDELPAVRTVLLLSLLFHGALIALDLGTVHSTSAAKIAATFLKKNSLFWIGGIVVGIIVPIVLLSVGVSGLSGLLALFGLLLYEKVWVKAGQIVPLS
jgi:formate-dependent nitrite reductase membrane component NrfD